MAFLLRNLIEPHYEILSSYLWHRALGRNHFGAAQVPNFNDCRYYAGSRALTQDQRRHSFVTVWHARVAWRSKFGNGSLEHVRRFPIRVGFPNQANSANPLS